MTMVGKSSGFGNMWKDIPDESRGKVVKLDDLKKEYPGLKIVDVYPSWDFEEKHVGMEKEELVESLKKVYDPFEARNFFYGTEKNYGGYLAYDCKCVGENEVIIGRPKIVGDGGGRDPKDRAYCKGCNSQVYEADAY